MAKVKLDEIDHQILDMLIDNTRTPFTDNIRWYGSRTGKKNGGSWNN